MSAAGVASFGGTATTTEGHCWYPLSASYPVTPTARALAGRSVALSDNVLVVGAPSVHVNNPSAETPLLLGSAWVYTVCCGFFVARCPWLAHLVATCCTLTQLPQAEQGTSTQPAFLATMNAPGGHGADAFGYAVATDGSFVVVGAPLYSSSLTERGAPYIYQLSAGFDEITWKASLTTYGTQYAHCGWSLALSGQTLFVGCKADDTEVVNAGTVYVFSIDGDTGAATMKTKIKHQ